MNLSSTLLGSLLALIGVALGMVISRRSTWCRHSFIEIPGSEGMSERSHFVRCVHCNYHTELTNVDYAKHLGEH